MAILRFSNEPTNCFFHDGTRGETVVSEKSGETEWKHFVNGPKASATIYLPKQAQAQLERLRNEAGKQPTDSIRAAITKVKAGRANNWEIWIVQPERQQPPAPQRLPEPATQGYQNYPAKATPTQGNPTPARETSNRNTARPEAKLMAAALCAAIDACQAAHEYHPKLTLDSGDVRAIAISMYIEACKQRAATGTAELERAA